MIPFFKNVDVDIYGYDKNTSFDEYGEIRDDYHYRDTVEGDLQVQTPESSLQEFGKILQDTYRLYVPLETELYDTDLLVIKQKKYEIMGSVQNWDHILPYKKVLIKLQRKNASFPMEAPEDPGVD